MAPPRLSLLERLGRFCCVFYLEERAAIAYEGIDEIRGIISDNLPTGDPFDDLPAIVPVWVGTLLDYADAFRRFGVPTVSAVVVGFPTAVRRRALVKAVRDNPPFGLIADEGQIGWRPEDRHLPLSGFVLPGAVIVPDAVGRRYDSLIGADVLGFDSDEDREMLYMAAYWSDPKDDVLPRALLRHLSLRATRRLPAGSGIDDFDTVMEHAEELLGLGAVAAAGTVAGVAFESLMRAALVDGDRGWLAERAAVGEHVSLATVIDRVVKGRQLAGSRGRLDAYRRLRNDLAHRLGDAPLDKTARRSDAEVYELVRDFVAWLAKQSIVDGVAELIDIAPQTTDPASLHAEALAAAEAAAAAIEPFATVVAGERIVEGPIGSAWVTVRDRQRAFPRWLAQQDGVRVVEGGVRFSAPQNHLQRALAWAWGYARYLRDHQVIADYGGRQD